MEPIASSEPTTASEPCTTGARIDESELVRRLRSGCAEAFAEVVRTQTRPLLAVTRRILMNEADASDAVQETFVAAFRGISSFAEESLLSTWLHRIAVNASLMQLRWRRRHPEDAIPDAPTRVGDEDVWMAGSSRAHGRIDDTIECRRIREEVRRAISLLPETHGRILLLRDLEDRSTAEAAALLGISCNAAKVRLHRARHALRTILEEGRRASGASGRCLRASDVAHSPRCRPRAGTCS